MHVQLHVYKISKMGRGNPDGSLCMNTCQYTVMQPNLHYSTCTSACPTFATILAHAPPTSSDGDWLPLLSPTGERSSLSLWALLMSVLDGSYDSLEAFRCRFMATLDPRRISRLVSMGQTSSEHSSGSASLLLSSPLTSWITPLTEREEDGPFMVAVVTRSRGQWSLGFSVRVSWSSRLELWNDERISAGADRLPV